jgi:hypothetical protein
MSFKLTSPNNGAVFAPGADVTVNGVGLPQDQFMSATFESEDTATEVDKPPQNPAHSFNKTVPAPNPAPAAEKNYVLVVKAGGRTVTRTVKVQVSNM